MLTMTRVFPFDENFFVDYDETFDYEVKVKFSHAPKSLKSILVKNKLRKFNLSLARDSRRSDTDFIRDVSSKSKANEVKLEGPTRRKRSRARRYSFTDISNRLLSFKLSSPKVALSKTKVKFSQNDDGMLNTNFHEHIIWQKRLRRVSSESNIPPLNNFPSTSFSSQQHFNSGVFRFTAEGGKIDIKNINVNSNSKSPTKSFDVSQINQRYSFKKRDEVDLRKKIKRELSFADEKGDKIDQITISETHYTTNFFSCRDLCTFSNVILGAKLIIFSICLIGVFYFLLK